jgi:hypothetical protein
MGYHQAKGIYPKQHQEQEESLKENPQIGTLRSMTLLIVDLAKVRDPGYQALVCMT